VSNKFKMLACASLAALATPVGAQVALAADSQPDQPPVQATDAVAGSRAATGDQDIVVTARRVEERLQDVPVAVSALGSAQLTQQGIREIRDLNAIVPNVSIQQANTGAGAVYITIRGQNLSNILLTIDPSVGTYMDGVNIPRPYGLRAGMVDLSRVEVLRGPQGTLYGKNTTGGTISFYTADPTDELGGKIEASAGNYDAYNLTGVLNVPLAENLAARFVLQRSAHDAYNKSLVTGLGTAKDDTWYGRAKIKYSGERLTAILTGDFTDLDMGGGPVAFRRSSTFGTTAALVAAIESGIAPNATSFAGLTPQQQAAAYAALDAENTGSFYRNNSNFTGATSKFKGQNISLDLMYELNDTLSVRSITGYRHFKTVYAQDGDATRYIINESYSPTKDDFFSQELQILGKHDRFNWVAGLYYSYEDGNLLEISRTAPAVAINAGAATLLTRTDTDVTGKSLGIFAQGNFEVSDSLSLTGGARWTREVKKATLHNGRYTGLGNADLTGGYGTFVCGIAINGVTLPANNCNRTESDTFEKISWLASANYKVAPDVLLYAKFATGFKGGGQQPRTTGTLEGAYAGFAPETITEYEIGFKSELFDRRVQLNVAAFYDRYKDIQKNQFVVPPVTLIANATKATVKGVEAELVLRPTDRLTLTANGGYLDAKYGRDKNPGCTTFYQTGCFFGQKWPAPKWNYALGARYIMPTSVGDLTTNVNWTWQDDLTLVADVPEFQFMTQKAYGLLSGRIGLNIDAWDAEVAVFGRNLTNKEYYSGAIRFQSLGFSNGYTGEPRTYGIQFIKRFGGI
jgi:iron complex outermembrane recepter protein